MKLNLRTLLILVIAITSLSVIYQDLKIQVTLLVLSISLNFLSKNFRRSFQRIYSRLKKMPKLIFTIFIFQTLFRKGGKEVFAIWKFSCTTEGLSYGAIASIRFTMIIVIAGLLFDIPSSKFMIAFRKWKFPYEISFLVASVIHFIPLMGKEILHSREALYLKGIEIENLTMRNRIKAFITLIFPILARSIIRVKYMAASLELRGFRLFKNRTYLHDNYLSKLDVFIQILVGIIFTTCVIFL